MNRDGQLFKIAKCAQTLIMGRAHGQNSTYIAQEYPSNHGRGMRPLCSLCTNLISFNSNKIWPKLKPIVNRTETG